MNHLLPMNNFTIQFVAQTPQLLREAIAAYGVSKRALTAIKFQGGKIMVNDQEQNVRYALQVGDCVSIEFPREQRSESLTPTYAPLAIQYEDDSLLIVNKPAYQSTIPSKEHPTNSLANDICGYLEQQGLAATAHIVTRLDRDTSGLVCVAKHRHMHHLMSELQKKGQIQRHYEAIVIGEVASQTIEAPIARSTTSIIERIVDSKGKYARTDVTLIGKGETAGVTYSHVALFLYTGRTHQIRVHMSYIGHTLLGDDLYGGDCTLINRQALHCAKLAFIHPITGAPINITMDLPQDMQKIVQQQ